MHYNSFISSYLVYYWDDCIKEERWVIEKRSIAARFRPLDINTYMYESGEGNVKMDLTEMVCEDMDSIQIAHYGVQKLVF